MTINWDYRIGNKIVGDLTDKTQAYESSTKNGGGNDGFYSRHEALQAFHGVMTGRQFSEYLLARGWTIKEAAMLSMTRFSYADCEVIGRDIRNVGIDLDIIRDAVFRAWHENRPVIFEFDSKDGALDSLIAWKVDSGKRTRYGLPSNGGIVRKNNAPKQYKRNRRGMGF